ncbi:DNA recombinase [Halobacteriovorax sp. BALOs_7]|uniref:ATP-dependent nuclease n=1 Tax=Halobacteriovorax sp. BALOs_7 TaxID=2109558 RepID=UPI000EA15448|nr:AAA family ATPase [Halobacteriovorax sp. BALOs_7]AYF45217.1 DNA recombinase [Halobacteriovorax sp. BALOs_7]
MHIKKLIVYNFKSFYGKFEISLDEGINIIVGDNEQGKSTILEAINLCLTGFVGGRYFKAELSEHLFNVDIVNEYLSSLNTDNKKEPPSFLLELYLDDDSIPEFMGDDNSLKSGNVGLYYKVQFDERYKLEYENLVKHGEINSLPIEYYEVVRSSFARNYLTNRQVPLKSALIDSSEFRYRNGSDVYVNRIIKDLLDEKELVEISQAHRGMKDEFKNHDAIKRINEKISKSSRVTKKNVTISTDLNTQSAWESSLSAYVDSVPFSLIGKGEQCLIKTNLALSHSKTIESNLLLLEEPENHLSYSKLNVLLDGIIRGSKDRQVILCTHSSYVANKLSLKNLILLANKKTVRLSDLSEDTYDFFKKVAGYDTLRLVLCDKAILVEGDSDELIVQKAYSDVKGRLPINDSIDVISVGVSFLRWLEIAEKINKEVCVVTDSDGDLSALKKKYKKYLDDPKKYSNIKICFDEIIDKGSLIVSGKPFNYNTLEPKILKANGLQVMNQVFETNYQDEDDLRKFMKNSKTECALKIFNTSHKINIPEYILKAINDE